MLTTSSPLCLQITDWKRNFNGENDQEASRHATMPVIVKRKKHFKVSKRETIQPGFMAFHLASLEQRETRKRLYKLGRPAFLT